MTTRWQVPPLWAGKTVAILTSLATPAQVASVAHLPRIAVRRACFLAPDADMLVALDAPYGPADGSFWDEAGDFAGLRVCGVECELEALYVNVPHEVVTLGANHVVHIRNNGLFAMRIAAMAGARRILLLGFDAARYEALHKFRGMAEALAALVAKLRAQGVAVDFIEGDYVS